MIKYVFLLITAFALLGCEKVLIKPRLAQDNFVVSETSPVIDIEIVVPTLQIIQQENIIAVPRGLSKQEIIENINVYDFTLSNKEMDEISSLRKKNLRLVDPEVRRPLWDIP